MRILATACVPFVLLAMSEMVTSEEPIQIVSDGAVTNPRQPQIAIDGDGAIFVVFGAGETVYCSRSIDGGKSFGKPVKIGDVSKLALGMRRGPRIVAGSDAVVISAISHDSGDLFAWRSSDRGDTWQGPVTVNDSPRAAREGLHAMAMGADGLVYCVWLDLRNSGTQIFGASSTNGGRTWSENRSIYASPSGTVCECCHPSVAIDAKGGIHVMWRNSLDGNRDMFTALSRDGGENFEKAVKLGTGRWALDGCPMDGGHLAATAPGKVVTVWRREKQLLSTATGQRGEQPVAFGEQPWIAVNADGSWISWVSKRGGNLWLVSPNSKQPAKLHDNATDSVLASSPDGKGLVVAVWETGKKQNSTIMSQVVSD